MLKEVSNKPVSLENIFLDHYQAIEAVKKQKKLLFEVADLLAEKLKSKNTVYVAGNGGSASDAQHFVGELVGRFQIERNPYSGICLNTDTSVMTAIANDYGYEEIFSRQLEGVAQPGDIFVGLSTSGNSNNIIKAVELAKKRGITTIGFLGRDGGKLRDKCDISFIIDSAITARVQEAHITLIHILCYLVEKQLYER